MRVKGYKCSKQGQRQKRTHSNGEELAMRTRAHDERHNSAEDVHYCQRTQTKGLDHLKSMLSLACDRALVVRVAWCVALIFIGGRRSVLHHLLELVEVDESVLVGIH